VLSADGTFSHNTAVSAVARRNWPRLLDYEPPCRDKHDERRVIDAETSATTAPCGDGLIDQPVQPNEVTAGAEWQPVEIDAEPRLGVHRFRLRSRRSAAVATTNPATINGSIGSNARAPGRSAFAWKSSAAM
jgi:hypothetical protein